MSLEIPRWLRCETCSKEDGNHISYWTQNLFVKDGKNYCREHAPTGSISTRSIS